MTTEEQPLISMRLTEWLDAQAETKRLELAIKQAYEILCSGEPPHSARESNARRVLRDATKVAAPSRAIRPQSLARERHESAWREKTGLR